MLSVPAALGESFGLYVVEAMAAGVPVVQPRHSGFVEILERAGGGILYDPEEPFAYESALSDLLLNPDKASELGAMRQRGRL